MALNVVTRGYGPSASIALVVTRGYFAGIAAPATAAAQPSGGWPDVNLETPAERAARIKRERQQLGIIPPEPESAVIAGEATHIGPAEQRAEPLLPGETKPEAKPLDYTDLIAGTAMAKALRDAEDEAIAILLLMA